MDQIGIFPFGQPVRPVVQQDRSPKRVFMLGVELFDRKEEKWRPLEVKDGQFTFVLAPAAGELLRFEHKKK